MRVLAILIDTGRELLYRKTILVYFGVVTLVLVSFALLLRTDVVDGVIASMSVAGLEASTSRGAFRLGEGAEATGLGGLSAQDFVRYVQLGAAFTLYPLAILMSIFATASLVPRMLEKGAIDLLLSKPIGRPALFASRYLGALLVATANLLYLTCGLGAILALKTGVWNGGFIWSGLVMSLYFACLLAFVVLAGVLLRSTTISVMLTAVVFFTSLMVRLPHANQDWPLMISGRIARFVTVGIVETLFHTLPRTYDFVQAAVALIRHEGGLQWGAVFGSALSGAGALGIAIIYFSRRDY